MKHISLIIIGIICIVTLTSCELFTSKSEPSPAWANEMISTMATGMNETMRVNQLRNQQYYNK